MPLKLNIRALRRLLLAVVLVLAPIVGFMLARREPSYGGISMRSWLSAASGASLEETQRLDAAQQVIRAMPVGKVLSKLIRFVRSKDGLTVTWVEKLSVIVHHPLKLHHASEDQQLGIAGFEALGTKAAPAVGELTQFLDDRECSFSACRALSAIGKPAEASLWSCLSNRDERVRSFAITALSGIADDAVTYVRNLEPSLHDPSEAVRFTAAGAIGDQTNIPAVAVPLLIGALRDPGAYVSACAASCLAHFGTNADFAVPALSNLVEIGREPLASAAINPLVAISPQQALPVLIRAVARKGAASGPALKCWMEFAPDQALPAVLERMQSPDFHARSECLAMLCACQAKQPNVLRAIEIASSDPVPVVAFAAQRCIAEEFERTHPNGPDFSDEPIFNGKSLSEWLRTERGPDGTFSDAGRNALQRMGTNAIPSLLQRLAYRLPPGHVPLYDVNLNAVNAFLTLGQDARPALPALEALMHSKDENLVLHAALAVSGTGPDALPCLLKGLRSEFEVVRNQSANSLTSIAGACSRERRLQFRLALVTHLDDPDDFVRRTMAEAIKELDAAEPATRPAVVS